MLGEALSLTVVVSVPQRTQMGEFDQESMGQAQTGWISRWRASRSERRAMEAARNRLEETSLHLLADTGFVEESKLPALRRPKIVLLTKVEAHDEMEPVYAIAAE